MEKKVKKVRIPDTDSIRELTEFWDTHEFTEVLDQLEPVTSRLFRRAPAKREKQKGRRKKVVEWVHGGSYAVRVEVPVFYPPGNPNEPCLEPATARWLDEIARKAREGDLSFLRKAGKVYQMVAC